MASAQWVSSVWLAVLPPIGESPEGTKLTGLPWGREGAAAWHLSLGQCAAAGLGWAGESAAQVGQALHRPLVRHIMGLDGNDISWPARWLAVAFIS